MYKIFFPAIALLTCATAAHASCTNPCGSTAGTVCEIIAAPSSGCTQIVALGLYTYAWDYTPTAAGTLELETCSSASTPTVIFKDEIGDAAIYPVTVTTSGTNTIDGIEYTSTAPLILLSTPHQSATLQCDGAGNWMTE